MNDVRVPSSLGFAMRRAGEESPESSRIMLGLLDAVEQDRAQSQRLLASELGIALGLVNAYLKRCIKKGLVKVRSAPARRYAYYLTPQGFAEKSRLTVDYLSYSFSFFRQAKTDCSALFKSCVRPRCRKVAARGPDRSCSRSRLFVRWSMESRLPASCRRALHKQEFIGLPVFENFDAVSGPFDAVLITDVLKPREPAKLRSRASASIACLCPICCESACGRKTEIRNDRRLPAHGTSCRRRRMPSTRRWLISPGKDLHTYLPRYLKRRRHARRIDIVAAPLFPRYLFRRNRHGVQRWRSIYSTVGVSRLVCNGDYPAPVSATDYRLAQGATRTSGLDPAR